MTFDALSHVTLVDVKRGGCCGSAYDGHLLYDTIGWRGFRPLYRGRFLGSLATRYVGHSCRARDVGGHGSDER